MMTESEFIRMSEELFEHIEDQIDENGWDFRLPVCRKRP